MGLRKLLLCLVAALLAFSIDRADGILCYQCDSNEDRSCPASLPFDPNINALVDCGALEAKVPGTFCAKIFQESSGWHGWTKITRRCAQVSETGVAWGCRFGFDDFGVYKETCYCQNADGCNSAYGVKASVALLASLLGLEVVRRLLFC